MTDLYLRNAASDISRAITAVETNQQHGAIARINSAQRSLEHAKQRLETSLKITSEAETNGALAQ